MAKSLVRINQDAQTSFLIEVIATGGEQDVAGGGIPIDQVRTAIDRLRPLFDAVKSVAAAAAPTKASVEVGLSFTWESGRLVSLLLAGSTEASIKVSMEWSAAKE